MLEPGDRKKLSEEESSSVDVLMNLISILWWHNFKVIIFFQNKNSVQY